jgi:surfactin synthase thioesterase subunit
MLSAEPDYQFSKRITRASVIPAGDGPSRRPKQEGKKSQRSLDNDDMLEALKQLQSRSEDIFEDADGTHWPDSGALLNKSDFG